MRPSRVLVMALAWVVVVAGASTLVWAVISRAGEHVVSQEPLVATTQDSRGPAPSGSASGTPSGPAGDGPATPGVERRTWQDRGMLLVAECDGQSIRRVAAQPATGYAVEIKDDGPEELEVEFEGREDESGSHVKVDARCVAGVPEFTSEVESDED